MKISIILTTYNRPDALKAVIQSLIAQKYLDHINLEICIADDGSKEETRAYIQQQKSPFPILHIWQPDEGFRAAKIRNRAVAKASGDYLIFLDADCIAPTYFIENHANLAQAGYFVTGNRVLLTQKFTKQVLNQHLPIYTWDFYQWFIARLTGKCNRAISFFPLLRWLYPYRLSNKWQGAKTCNLALWRKDFIAINGFDERYEGWGYEDSDLVIRLMRSGVQRKHTRFCIPVLHLWHSENDRSQEVNNRLSLQAILESDSVLANRGVDQYLP